MRHRLIILAALLCSTSVIGGGVYQEPEAFINEVFGASKVDTRIIWPDETLQQQMAAILDHKYRGMRIRYWIDGSRTAWILDEIGKEKPITTGIVINHNKIERVRILAFRESRGWEVKHSFFTQQFDNASLGNDMRLDHSIDNISGATLSVRAVTKLARIALLLHQQVMADGAS